MIPLGPFELIQPIGRGGSCEVWRGRHREQDMPVAVKVVFGRKARTPRFISAFREEVRAVAGLHHPSIVMVFDYGLIPAATAAQSGDKLQAGSPYLVMELGEDTLHAFCDRLDWPDIYRILLALLDGLAHAHARGVIHRDLKPANILVNNHRREIKLSDFGLAHAIGRDERPRHSREIVGTPSYMAPEQFELRWRDYGPWTDLYAFGCTTYALLCGFPPFGRTEQLEDMMAAHLYQAIPRLPPRLPVPEGFEEWLRRLLHKDPGHRFQRAADAAWSLMQLEQERSPNELERQWAQEHRSSPFAPREGAPDPGYDDIDGPTLHTLQGLIGGGTPTPSALPALVPEFQQASEASSTPSLPPAEVQEVMPEPEESRPPLQIDVGSIQPPPEVEETINHPPELDIDLSVFPPSTQEPSVETTRSLKRLGQEEDDLDEVTPHPFYASSMPEDIPPIPPFPGTWRRDALSEQSRLLNDVGLGLYGLRTVPLVAREDERDELWDALHSVVLQKEARLVSLTGPAGCGKSRLAQWLCERAHEVGAAHILHAYHSPIPGPADGFGAMLSRDLRCSGLSRSKILARVEAGLTTRSSIAIEECYALTELIAPHSNKSPSQELPLIRFDNPTERYEAVRKYLERLSQRRSLIVWLEDVHWSFDALSFASYLMESQATRPIPVLLLATSRSEALVEREGEAALLRELVERQGAQEIVVGPLTDQENSDLVQELLGLRGELALQVEQRTAGNPLFAVQLVGDWVQRGLLQRSAQGFRLRPGVRVEIPDSLHQVWIDRIDQILENRFPEEAMGLELAATLGIEVDRSEWIEVCDIAGIPVPDTLLEQLFEQRLAYSIEGSSEGSWSFVHSMLRESLERRAREAERWAGHQEACALMLQKKRGRGTAERLGRHLLQSGDIQGALKPLLKGIWEHVDAGDFRLAELLFAEWRSKLTQLGLPASDKYWGEAWLLRSRIARGTGSYEEGGRHSAMLVKDARKHGWGKILIYALLEQANCSWRLGVDEDEVWVMLEEAERLALDIPKIRAECRRYMGNFLCLRGKLHKASDCLILAHDTFEFLGDDVGMARCCYGLSNVERQAGRFSHARRHIKRAQEHYEACGSRRGIVDCLNSLGDLARFEGDLAQSETYYRESLARYEALGAGDTTISKLNIVLVLLQRQHYEEAQVLLEEIIIHLHEKGQKDLEGIAHLCLLPIKGARHQWDAWDYHYEQARFLLDETGLCDVDTARVAELAGDIAKAAHQLPRARTAFAMAVRQWELLGRDEEIARLQPKIAM